MPRMKHMRRREQCYKTVSVYIDHRYCLVALFTCKRYCLVALQPPVASQKGEGEEEMGKDQSGSAGAVNKRGGRTLHSPRCSRRWRRRKNAPPSHQAPTGRIGSSTSVPVTPLTCPFVYSRRSWGGNGDRLHTRETTSLFGEQTCLVNQMSGRGGGRKPRISGWKEVTSPLL